MMMMMMMMIFGEGTNHKDPHYAFLLPATSYFLSHMFNYYPFGNESHHTKFYGKRHHHYRQLINYNTARVIIMLFSTFHKGER